MCLQVVEPVHPLVPTRRTVDFEYWIFFAIACLLLCLPIFLVSYTPLVDYPSHLARAYVIANISDTSVFQQNYILAHEPLPNLASDIIITPLLRFVGFRTAGRMFLVATVLLFALGCHLMGKTIAGCPVKRAILCAFFVYNSMFFYGFVNYVFGLGMFLVGLSLWLRWHTQWTIVRYCAVMVFVSLTYLSHLTAWVFLALAFAIVCMSEFHFDDWVRPLQSFALFAPEIILFISYRHPSPGETAWGTLREKLIGAMPLLLTYNYSFDIVLATLLLVLGVYLVRRSRAMKLLWPSSGIGAAFCVLYAISPHVWRGGSPVDARFIPPALILIVLSLEVRLSRPVARRLFISFLIVLVFRLCAIVVAWIPLSREIDSQVRLLTTLPQDVTLYPVFVPAPMADGTAKLDRALKHVPEYATITNHVFVPTQLAFPGQENLLFRNPLQYESASHSSKRWIDYMRQYDFVWLFDPTNDVQEEISNNCDWIDGRNGFSLWRVRKR
jgi:hypothetical protein